MLVDYFYWQYIAAPRWLAQVIWNVQLALVQLFSVKLMVRTLFAHWHRDTMPFQGGTLSDLGLSILWNVVSRLMGAFVRLSVLGLWLLVEALYLGFVAIAFPLFLLGPALVIVGIATGLALFIV